MLYPLDERGYVINESAVERVQKKYIPVVDGIVGLLKDRLGLNLLSIHIRGSVSVGRAIPSISDIDVVVLVSEELTLDAHKRLRAKIEVFSVTYPFIPFFDVTVLTKEQLTRTPEYRNLCVYLATQSYCAWGTDMLEFLPRVRPGRELAIHMYQNVEEELHSLRETIAGTRRRTYLGQEQQISFWCVWLTRVLLRTGLGVVMFRKLVFSQDLVTCGTELVELYPELEQMVQEALTYAMQPTNDKEKLLNFYDTYVPNFIQIWNANAYAKE